jgi:hypothetical protein
MLRPENSTFSMLRTPSFSEDCAPIPLFSFSTAEEELPLLNLTISSPGTNSESLRGNDTTARMTVRQSAFFITPPVSGNGRVDSAGTITSHNVSVLMGV